jgi:hypothetical protein
MTPARPLIRVYSLSEPCRICRQPKKPERAWATTCEDCEDAGDTELELDDAAALEALNRDVGGEG